MKTMTIDRDERELVKAALVDRMDRLAQAADDANPFQRADAVAERLALRALVRRIDLAEMDEAVELAAVLAGAD